jgi:hypothetical protein
VENLGYARVSTNGQDLSAQVAELEAAGCAKIYREKRRQRQIPEAPLDDAHLPCRHLPSGGLQTTHMTNAPLANEIAHLRGLEVAGLGRRCARAGTFNRHEP